MDALDALAGEDELSAEVVMDAQAGRNMARLHKEQRPSHNAKADQRAALIDMLINLLDSATRNTGND